MSMCLDVEDFKLDAVAVQAQRCLVSPHMLTKLLPQVSMCVQSTSSEPENKQWAQICGCLNVGFTLGAARDILKYSLLRGRPPLCAPSLRKFGASDAYPIPVVLNWGNSVLFQGIFGNVWRYFVFVMTRGERCYWHLVDRGRDAITPYNEQDNTRQQRRIRPVCPQFLVEKSCSILIDYSPSPRKNHTKYQ